MGTEIWKAVVGWEGLYEVSDLGRVRSLGQSYQLRHLKQGPVTAWRAGRVLNPATVMGYLQVSLTRDGSAKLKKVHRLVLDAFVGRCPKGKEGRHLDGNRTNNRRPNLAWGTKLENAADRKAHGTQCIGETHGRAKVTETDVRAIRKMYAAGGIKQIDLAAQYGIGQSKISAIIRRETWAHIQ